MKTLLFILFTLVTNSILFFHKIVANELSHSQIFNWIEKDNMTAINKISPNDPSLSLRNEDGLTPLHWAAGLGKIEITQLLIDKGADIFALDSTMGVSILHKAVYSGNSQTVSLLIKNKAMLNLQSPSNGNTPLHDALYFKVGKDHSVIKTLLKAGVSLDIKNRAGLTAIDSAKVLGDEESQSLILEELNSRHSTKGKALMKAVRNHKILEVKTLLFDSKMSIDERDDDGFTPLLWASRRGYTQIVQLLLNKGANPNTLDYWMKANSGHKAGFWGQEQTMKLLVENGLDINARGGYNGYTPLHDAVTQNHYEVVALLVKAGARVDIKGHDGKTALDIARNAHFEKILKLLETR